MSATATSPRLFRVRQQRWAKRNAWSLGVYAILVLMLILEKIVHRQVGAFDYQSLVIGTLPLAFAAMAQTAVVLSGGIDLSIGAMMSLVNVVAADWMMNADLKGAILISLVLIAGTALLGGLIGAVITVTGIPDIIVTLATSFIWAGVALQIMPIPGGASPFDFNNLVLGEVASVVPEGLIVLLAILLVVWGPFLRSRLGLALYALGSSRPAAYLSGVSVARSRMVAYALGGVFTALGGLALTASTGSGSALSGTSYTLNSVGAIVLGGVSLAGGHGGMIGPVAAAFILTLIGTILTFLNVDQNYATVIQGAVVVLVVMIAGFLTFRRQT